MACEYCISLIRGEHRDGSNDGCKQIQNQEERYARLNDLGEYLAPKLREARIDFVNGIKGCEKFEASGVPAHPEALEVLVEKNSRCRSIPVDPKSLETSWEFYAKLNKFLPKENIVDYTKVQ